MQNDTVLIKWPPVPVGDLGDAMEPMLSGFQALWAAGRLRHLTENAETRRALEVFAHGRSEAVHQWARATESGSPTVSFAIEFPQEAALLTVALVRRLVSLLSDAETMGAVGEPVLKPEARALIDALIDHAERVLDQHEG